MTYYTKINEKRTKCPICNRIGEYEQLDYEKICKCGYVYYTPYNYVAGIKINTDLKYKKRKVYKKEKENKK